MGHSQRFVLENSPQIAKIIAIHQNCRRYCRKAHLYPIWSVKELRCHFLAEHSHQHSMVTQIRADKTISLHKFYLIWIQMEFPRCLFLHNTIMHCPLFINWKNGMIPAEKSLSCKYYILEEWHNIHINIAHTLHSA